MKYTITIETKDRAVLAQLLQDIEQSSAVEYDLTVNTDGGSDD